LILLKHKPHSSGIRHKKNSIFFFYKHIRKKFSFISRVKNTARSNTHGILAYSRKSPSLKKSIRLNYQRYLTAKIGVFIKFHFHYKHTVYKGLIKFSNGAYCNLAIPDGLLPGAHVKTTNLPHNLISSYSLGDSVVLY
jgi:ribosomal protein L2